MPVADLKPNEKVAFAVGAIVLRCQEIERLVKFVVPFISGGSPTWTEIWRRSDELARKTLGEVAGKFVECWSGDVEIFKAYVKEVVDRRNSVVHHFGDVYGARWAAGKQDDVLLELKQLHQDTTALLRVLRELTAEIAEKTRDTLFVGTDELDGFSAMCENLRASADNCH